MGGDAVVDRCVERRGGDGDDRQRDDGRDVGHGRVHAASAEVTARPVDGVDGHGGRGGDVAPHRGADRSGAIRRTDDGDRPGEEHAGDRPAVGPLLATAHRVDELRSRGDGEVDLDHATVVAALERPPGAGEHGEHRAVLPEHLGGEPLDAVGHGDGGEVLEEQRGDPDALVGVVDHERRIGVVTARPSFVAGPAEQLAVRLDEQGGAVDEVDVGEVGQLTLAQPRLRREVPAIATLVGLSFVELRQSRRVRRSDRTDRNRLPVAEDGVRRPRRRVGHAVVS